MDIRDLRNGPHLSASSINDYLECGLYYRFSRIENLKPEFKSDNLEFGSCIHKTLADFHLERLMGNKIGLRSFQESFERHWRQRAEGNKGIVYREGKDFDILMTEGKILLATYYKNRRADDNSTVLAIEEPFRLAIECLPIPIIGVMDLVEEDQAESIIITDFKTASRTYSAEEANRNLQLSIYYLAARANGYRERDIRLKLDCLIKTKKPKFVQLLTSRSEADEMRAIKKIKEVWEAIQKGIYIPNDESWKCKECAYKKLCSLWPEE